jgi:hypothetical protein
MKARLIAITAMALALVAATALASSATARGVADTDVTIAGQEGDYHGKVLSEKNSCQNNRTVNVFKKRAGKDLKIGSDTSEIQNGVGKWEIGNSGYKHGRFYAKVRRTDACSGARSRTIQR